MIGYIIGIVIIILLVTLLGFIIYKVNAFNNSLQPYADIATKIGENIPGVIDTGIKIIEGAAPRIIENIDKTSKTFEKINKNISTVTDLPSATLPDRCPVGYEKDSLGILCYPKCKPGFKQNGLFCEDDGSICNNAELKDLGLTCGRTVKSDIKGFPWKFGDPPFNLDRAKRDCEAAYPTTGCENILSIYYGKCPVDTDKIGLQCYRKCPAGTTNLGLICAKPARSASYPRIAVPLSECAPELEKRGTLCYPRESMLVEN